MPSHVNDRAVIARLLDTPATWAVIGLSTNQQRRAYDVAASLQEDFGMTIIPVHPRAEQVLGRPGYPDLAAIPDGTRVDVVDCFVRSDLVGAVVDQAIAQRERLGISAVWMQLRVIDEQAAARATAAGLDVVMNTCPLIEQGHRTGH